MSKLFTSVYIITIIIVRGIVYASTKLYPQTYSDNWHHLYTGLIILLAVLFLNNLLNKKLSVILLAIAFGLIADELILLPINYIFKPDPIQNYWSWYSVISLIVLSLIVIKWQNRILKLFNNKSRRSRTTG